MSARPLAARRVARDDRADDVDDRGRVGRVDQGDAAAALAGRRSPVVVAVLPVIVLFWIAPGASPC